jgi:hypothetical protein
MIFVKDNEVIELNYTCKTSQVSYSIADFVGNVLIRGNYDCLDENRIPIKNLTKGAYTLCIVDGDCLTKIRFQKN